MKDINRDEIIKLLFLISCFGAGKPRIHELKEKFGSLEELYRAIAFRKPEGVFTQSELKAASRIHGSQLRGIISYCESHNIGVICCGDEEYPERLKNIYNPPILLFYRGDPQILKNDIILAVVGSRKMSAYTEKATSKIAGTIAANGITVASGFAVGTDITAHLSAVRNGGKTIAVLGCGIDHCYPAENMRYTEEILQNGIFISEYPPQTAAQSGFFVARNRILAGISVGAAVMEASEKSGSLNTASYALAQGSDLWVMPPHDIFDSRYNGGKALLADGALPIYSADDILREYFDNYSHKPVKKMISDFISLDKAEEKPEEHSEPPKQRADAEKSAAKAQRKPEKRREPPKQRADVGKITEKPSGKAENSAEPSLDGGAKIVYNIIKGSKQPVSSDEISERSGMDISEVLSTITELEIEGLIFTETGQTFYT